MMVKVYNHILVLIFIFISHLAFAQESVPIFDLENKKYQTSMEKFYKDRSIIRSNVTQIFEAELEDSDYMVGPGDRFKVNIFGELENELECEILPEGNVILPTIGEFNIGGHTLKEAKEIIVDKVKPYYRGHISANLVALRNFRVYLTGEVQVPGTYFAQGSDRISDVLEIANGVTDWANDTKVEIRHLNGTLDIIDLNRFYLNGEKNNNPLLQSGDLIFIPAIDVGEGYVIVEGNAERTRSLELVDETPSQLSNLLGIYPLKKDEKFYEFLRRIGGLTRRSDLEKIILIRNGEKREINLLDQTSDFTNLELKNKDRILIPSIVDRVYVEGEVQRPGGQAYYANYTAMDYVGRAGALVTSSGPESYIVLRSKTGESEKGGDVIVEKGDTIIVPKRAREVAKDYLVILTPVISLTISLILLLKP